LIPAARSPIPAIGPNRQKGPLMHLGSFTLGVSHIQPLAALIAGVLILIVPRLLNYIVAIFLILSGLLGLGFLR
jgi:hypothetical protein